MANNYAIVGHYVSTYGSRTEDKCYGTVKNKASAKRATVLMQMYYSGLKVTIKKQKQKIAKNIELREAIDPANESRIKFDALSKI